MRSQIFFLTYSDSGLGEHVHSLQATSCNDDLKVSFKPDLRVLQPTAIVLPILISSYLLSPLLKHKEEVKKKKTPCSDSPSPGRPAPSVNRSRAPAEARVLKCKVPFKNMPARQQRCHQKKKSPSFRCCGISAATPAA